MHSTGDGELPDAMAWFDQYMTSVRVTGTTATGNEVEMDIPFDSPWGRRDPRPHGSSQNA